jgi:hypothetical protein
MPSTDFNNDFRIIFRNFVLNTDVAGLIDDRFLGAYLATFYTSTTTFPLATFHPQGGSLPNLNIIQDFTLIINCYSNESYDEAYTVDKAFMDILGGANGPVTINDNIIIRPISTPSETFDEIARLYGINRRYKVIYLP